METDTYQKLQWELQHLRRENLLAYKDSFLTRLNRYCRIKSITYLLNTFGKSQKHLHQALLQQKSKSLKITHLQTETLHQPLHQQISNQILISSDNQTEPKNPTFGGQGG